MKRHHHFDWDPAKAGTNALKHRVTFEDAEAVLSDDQPELYHVDRYDDKHSMSEDRFITIGSDPIDRQIILFIVWTQRHDKKGRILTRVISARRATRKERSRYVKEIGKR
jgi:uncharacterized DUF497 family protein